MNTCRVCKKTSFEHHRYPLMKYSVRHYAHADCGLRKWGRQFLLRFSRRTLYESFPALAASDAGLLSDLITLASAPEEQR